jgi:hypothetical protein
MKLGASILLAVSLTSGLAKGDSDSPSHFADRHPSSLGV